MNGMKKAAELVLAVAKEKATSPKALSVLKIAEQHFANKQFGIAKAVAFESLQIDFGARNAFYMVKGNK